MARNDIRIVDTGGHNVVPTYRWQVASGAAASIKAGEPTKASSNGSPYVILLVDGDHTIGTDTSIFGVAASDSTDTASADGTVDLYMPLPGILYEMKATTTANVNTRAKIDLLRGDRITMDLASSTFTLDENDGEAQTAAFLLVDGDPSTFQMKFLIRHGATALGDQDLS